MFVFAADDVSKKDLKKISKKIEKQVAKWEEKDQEREKRKRESDTGAGVSEESVKKKLKVENESVSNTEISSTVKRKHCDWIGNERVSESTRKRQSPLRGVDDKTESEKVTKMTEVPDASLLEECEVLVDIDETGACDFAVVCDKSDKKVSEKIVQSDENEHALTKHTKDQLNHINVDNGDFEGGLTEELYETLEECDLIVEINEKGSCNFTVLSDNSNTDIKAEETVDADSSSNFHSNSFYLCKCRKNVDANVTDSVCGNCENESFVQTCKSSFQDFQSESNRAELKWEDAEFKKSIKANNSADLANVHAKSSYFKENAYHNKRSSVSDSLNVGHVQSTEIHHVSVNLDATERTAGLDEGFSSSACDINHNPNSTPNKRIVRLVTEEQTREGEETDVTDLTDEERCNIIPKTIPAESEIVALDCEFVGVGPNNQSALGRCSIVDFHGKVICDIYARPEERITDYRTRWSGITRHHMKKSIPIHSALSQIAGIIRNKVVVGHAVHNDFLVLGIPHSPSRIRDTAKYRPLLKRINPPVVNQSVSLKRLALHLLGKVIQTRQHCSVEDSRAAMEVYKLVRDEWENRIVQGESVEDQIIKPSGSAENRRKRRQKKLKKLEKLKRTRSAIEMTNLGSQNESQSSSFHRSLSDLELSSGQINIASNDYYFHRNDASDRHSNHGNRSWTEGQNRHVIFDYSDDSGYYGNEVYGNAGYLGDEYWEDVIESDMNLFENM